MAGGGATIRRRERHDTTQEACDTAPCATIWCATRRAIHDLRHGALALAWAQQHGSGCLLHGRVRP